MPGKMCEICGERTALYLCQECGSAICPLCHRGWICQKCSQKATIPQEETPRGISLSQLGLLTVAIAIILVGIILVFLGSSGLGTSGVCFFWPVPLIVGCGFGSGGGTVLTLGFLVILAASMLLLLWWFGRWSRFPALES